jgi:hypothetical protein
LADLILTVHFAWSGCDVIVSGTVVVRRGLGLVLGLPLRTK